MLALHTNTHSDFPVEDLLVSLIEVLAGIGLFDCAQQTIIVSKTKSRKNLMTLKIFKTG